MTVIAEGKGIGIGSMNAANALGLKGTGTKGRE
jgi:hypothetical protein